MPLVCIEGIDSSGKATQARLLADAFGGEVLSFPDYGTETGRLIHAFLREDLYVQARRGEDGSHGACDHEQALVLQALMTANRYERGAELAERAASPRVTVLDRYWASGYAYGVADGLDGAWLEALHALLPAPAVSILLDVAPGESFRRRPERRDAYEADAGRLARARAAYFELFERRRAAGEPWCVVDGARSVEGVCADVYRIVQSAVLGIL